MRKLTPVDVLDIVFFLILGLVALGALTFCSSSRGPEGEFLSGSYRGASGRGAPKTCTYDQATEVISCKEF